MSEVNPEAATGQLANEAVRSGFDSTDPASRRLRRQETAAAAGLSAVALQREVARRGTSFLLDTTRAFVDRELVLGPITVEDLLLTEEAEYFKDPGIQLDAREQLDFTSSFLKRLGLTPPTPNAPQMERIEYWVNQYPDRRIMPTPLQSLEERVKTAEVGRMNLPGQQFRKAGDKPGQGSALWVPGPEATFGNALRNLDRRVPDRTEPAVGYRVLYKDPTGSPALMDRKTFIAQLMSSGQVTYDERGTPWAYLITDVSTNPRPSDSGSDINAGQLYEQASPFALPELLELTQLLHQVSGGPSRDWLHDISSEALHKVNEDGTPIDESLVRMTAVRWDVDGHYIHAGGVDLEKRNGRYGIRPTSSALASVS